jgi:hypothetical protein
LLGCVAERFSAPARQPFAYVGALQAFHQYTIEPVDGVPRRAGQSRRAEIGRTVAGMLCSDHLKQLTGEPLTA